MPSTDEPRCDVCGEETDLLVPQSDEDGRHVLVCQECEVEILDRERDQV